MPARVTRKRALVFPGQGAEEPAMGLTRASTDQRAKRLLELASEATKVDLVRALERGGRALTRTDVLQPALVAVALGAAHALSDEPVVVLGHSLGELAAACFALDVPDEIAIGLAATRGRLMQAAAELRPGGMLALATGEGLPEDVVVAAYNADDEVVVSGDVEAIERLGRMRPDATRLRVSGAWHSPSMAFAVEPFRAALGGALAGRAMRIPLLSATTAGIASASQVAEVLARGLVSPVRWAASLRALDVTDLVLAPPTRVSRSLARRTLGRTIAIEDLA